MNKQTYEAIQYFIELAKLGSITLVAKSLNIDHKAIKQKILLLENTLNMNLINSTHKGTELTSDGLIFYHRISNKYTSFNVMINTFINRINYQTKNSINLLLPPASGLLFTRHVLPKLYEKYPEVNVHITTFDISYIKNYGSHVNTLLNKYNLIMVDDLNIHLINQDEWLLSFRQNDQASLYASQSYIDNLKINEINDLNKADLIGRAGTFEESGIVKLVNLNNLPPTMIQFNKIYTAQNDLIKAQLANNGVGVALLTNLIFNCGQDINLVNLFPEYLSKLTHNYSILYKKNDIHKRYVKSIAEITKSVVNELGL